MPSSIPVTTRSYFRTLSILHLALVMGQVMFAFIAVLLKFTQEKVLVSFSLEVHELLQYFAPALALLGIAASRLLFSRKIKSLKALNAPADQYTGYRNAVLMRYAVLEAPSLITLLLFLLTGDYFFLGIGALIILIFITIRPGKAALLKHLQPDYNQQLLLEDPDAVLYEDNSFLKR